MGPIPDAEVRISHRDDDGLARFTNLECLFELGYWMSTAVKPAVIARNILPLRKEYVSAVAE